MLSHHGLKDEYYNCVISDQHLQEIARECCEQWRLLPPYLDVPKIWTSDLDRTPIPQEEKRCTFFEKWKSEKKHDATYRSLIDALLKIECKEDANHVCELLKCSPPPPGFNFQPIIAGKFVVIDLACYTM